METMMMTTTMGMTMIMEKETKMKRMTMDPEIMETMMMTTTMGMTMIMEKETKMKRMTMDPEIMETMMTMAMTRIMAKMGMTTETANRNHLKRNLREMLRKRLTQTMMS
jgi:ABC-type polysaccharide/polyol phosphate export permease